MTDSAPDAAAPERRPGCALCPSDPSPAGLSLLPARDHVYSDGSWRVLVNKSALRGWLLVPTLRHVATLAELTPDEQRSMGRMLSLASRALADVVGCEKTYAMMFAEGTPHVHFSLVPRMADIPDHLKGAKVSGYNAEGPALEDDEREALGEQLRERFRSLAGAQATR